MAKGQYNTCLVIGDIKLQGVSVTSSQTASDKPGRLEVREATSHHFQHF